MTKRSLSLALSSLAVPFGLAAQSADAGRDALRPHVHVFLAYAVVWLFILLWVWVIARHLKRLPGVAGPDEG